MHRGFWSPANINTITNPAVLSVTVTIAEAFTLCHILEDQSRITEQIGSVRFRCPYAD